MLGEKIYRAMQIAQEQEGRRALSMSSMGYCEYKLMLEQIRGEQKQIDAETQMRFAVGTATHEYLQRLLYNTRIDDLEILEIEKSCSIGKLTGHIDLIAKINGIKTIVDFKIVDSNYFKMIQTPPEPNIDQVQLYAYAEDIQDILLLYICKSTGEFKEFPLKLDCERAINLSIKYDIIMEGRAEKKACPDWECSKRYCQYVRECWPEKSYIKNDNTKKIDSELEKKYLDLKTQIENLEEELSSVKKEIETELQGSEGIGDQIKAAYTPASESITYEKAQLERLISPDLLEKCKKTSQKKAFYTIRKI